MAKIKLEVDDGRPIMYIYGDGSLNILDVVALVNIILGN